MAETADDGVQAITTLLETLRPLSPETRANVLDFVFKTLGIAAPHAADPPPAVVPGVPLSATPAASPALGGVQNLRTLTEQKKPKTVNQMVAVMAHYLADLAPQGERRDYIVAEDIKKYFVQANFPQPTGRHAGTLVNAKNAGYLDALSNGQYRLNPVGHNLVAHKLPMSDDAPGRSARRARSAKKRTAKKGVSKKGRR
ncbi:hypothetical protein [Bradyrhizobium sp. USDA 4529]